MIFQFAKRYLTNFNMTIGGLQEKKMLNYSCEKKGVMIMDIGKYLIKARKLKGMSQEEVAQSLNVSRQSVSLWECDQTIPSLDNLIALSKLYNVSVSVLTGQEEFEDARMINEDDIEIDQEMIERENYKKYKVFLILAFVFLGLSSITVIVPVLSTLMIAPTITFSILSMKRIKNNYNLLTLILGISLFIASIFAYIYEGTIMYLA